MKEEGLINDEEVIRRLKPHVVSFTNQFLIGVYIFAIGFLLILSGDEIINAVPAFIVEAISLLLAFSLNLTVSTQLISYLIIVWVALAVPGMLISLFKIHWKWALTFVGIACFITFLCLRYTFSRGQINTIMMIIGILGIIGTESYRRSHNYFITNQRIITEAGLMKSEKRSISYDKLSDIIVTKTLLGKIFNFGTIIPVSKSGFGMGSDMAFVGIGAGKKGVGVGVGGGQTVSTPQGRSLYILYGIPNPDETYKLIFEEMRKTEEAPYLEKISNDIGKLSKKK